MNTVLAMTSDAEKWQEKGMNASRKPKQMRALQTAVMKGYGSHRPAVEGLALPAIDKPHVIIFFRGEEFDLYVVLEESVARNLREELTINLK